MTSAGAGSGSRAIVTSTAFDGVPLRVVVFENSGRTAYRYVPFVNPVSVNVRSEAARLRHT